MVDNKNVQKQPWTMVVCVPVILVCPMGHRWSINIQIASITSPVCPDCHRKAKIGWSVEGIPSIVDDGMHIATPAKPGIIEP